MKFLFVFLFSFLNVVALAQTHLPDFRFHLTDISIRGQSRDALFSSLNRSLIKTGASICSNRALVWNYDMKRFQNIDSGKIFLFYTGKTGEIGDKKWWYHVAPVVNERGQLWVLDGGFPGYIRRPMTVSEWLGKFVNSSQCRVIQSQDRNLFELMFRSRMFPEWTPQYGSADCYTYVAPGTYWTPASVAQGILQENSEGRPIRYLRDNFDLDELLQACKEAAAGRLGTVLGGQKKKCKEYLGIWD